MSDNILQQVLAGRSDFYLALAGFYLRPLTQEQIDKMAQTDYTAFDVDDTQLSAGFNDITRYLRKRNSGTKQMLAVDYTSSFGGAQSYEGRSAVPYASVFLSEEGLLSQKPRGEVFAIYMRNMLKVTDVSTPDDHLSFMLEFLAIMSQRCAEFYEQGFMEQAREVLIESRNFINEQILTWFDKLAQLANKLISTRFYRGVLLITEGYLKADLETIDDLLEELS